MFSFGANAGHPALVPSSTAEGVSDAQLQQVRLMLAPYLQSGASPESESSESLLRFCIGELHKTGDGDMFDVLYELYPGVLQLKPPEMDALIDSIRALMPIDPSPTAVIAPGAFGAPSTAFGALSTAFGAPSAAFGAPSTAFGAPSTAFGAPSTAFGAPSTAFGATGFAFGLLGPAPAPAPASAAAIPTFGGFSLPFGAPAVPGPGAPTSLAMPASGFGTFGSASPPFYSPASPFTPAFGAPGVFGCPHVPPSPFGTPPAFGAPLSTGGPFGASGLKTSGGGVFAGGFPAFGMPYKPPTTFGFNNAANFPFGAAPVAPAAGSTFPKFGAPGGFGTPSGLGGASHPYKIVCPFWLKGACKFGSKCANIHDEKAKVGGGGSVGSAGGGSAKAQDPAVSEADYANVNWSEYMGQSMMLPMSDELLAYYNSTAYFEEEGTIAPNVAPDALLGPLADSESRAPAAGLGPDLPPAPKHPPRGLMRALSTGREVELDSMSAVYREELIKIQAEFDDDGILKPMSGLRATHHFGPKVPSEAAASNANTKKIFREVTRELLKSLTVEARGSMFIRYDADEPQFLRAVLTGMDNTPYASGCFMFDIYLPPGYPEEPPQCVHTTKNATVKSLHADHSPGGFSPNLHRDSGKVCLSLLGTWAGPGWEAGKSNLYQLLSSIQLMILGAEHPYYMEPNYGGWEGTAPSHPGVDPVNGRAAIQFEENVRVHTVWLAILNPLLSSPVGFEKAVLSHFLSKRKLIVAVLDSWMRKTKTPRLKAQLQEKVDLVLDAYEQHLSLEDLRADFFDCVSSVRYIRKKQMALSCHLDFIGEDKRLERLLAEGEMLLRYQKAILARARRRYMARTTKAAPAAADAAAVEATCAPLTKKLRVVCPGYNLRIRSAPTAQGEDNVIGLINTGSILEVLVEAKDGFWVLTNSSGFVMINAPEVSWEELM